MIPATFLVVEIGFLAVMSIVCCGIGLMCYGMTCEVRHAIADLQTSFMLSREGAKPEDVHNFLLSKEPVQKGQIRFQIPNVMKSPFAI